MDSNKIKVILVVVLAAFMAVFLGVTAATDKSQAVIWVTLGCTLALIVGLGNRVWILIPTTAALVGMVNAVPGTPSAWYLGVVLGGGMMGLRFLLRSNDFQWRWTWMDSLVFLHGLVLAQAYFRNPTGLSILGGETAGGRAYPEYFLAMVGFYCLSFIRLDADTLRKAILIFLVVSLGDTFLKAISGFFPTLALAVSRVYSNIDYAAAADGMGLGQFELSLDTRFGSLAEISQLVALICLSFHRPITCLLPLYPGRFLAFSISIVAIMFSGFRSGLIRIGMLFVASCLAKRKPIDFAVAALIGIMLLATLAATDQLKSLPFAAQRVLSFLPVNIDERARHDAQSSSEWRFEMWRIVLTQDKYIKNKVLGDGFGFSAVEQTAFYNALAKKGYMSYEENMDYFIAKGSFHGFHVEAIRFTGVVGLIVAMTILVAFAFIAAKQIKHFRGTKLEGYVCIICLPLLVDPLYSFFVYGSYKTGFVKYILVAGILKMIDNVRASEIRASETLPTTEPESIRISSPSGRPAYSSSARTN